MRSSHFSWLCVVTLMWWGLVNNPLNAAIIDDLYDAKVAVSDQSDATQNAAIKQALRQVLIKASGTQDLLKHPHIVKELSRATALIRLYTYEKIDSQLYLVVNFDPEKVQNAIRTAGFPVWDKRRPDILLWLAIETARQDKQILTVETHADLVKRIKEQAQKRGINVIMPVWDLADIQNVDVYDIWGGFMQQLLVASERYEISTLLSARIYRTPVEEGQAEPPQTWQADWTLTDNGQLNAGQLQMAQAAQIVDGIVDALASQLAAKYAVSQQNSQLNALKIQINIDNVDTIVRYAQVVKFLKGLTVVSSATLIEQVGSRATFELSLLGSYDDLLNTFRLDNHIQTKPPSGQKDAELEFIWVN